MYALRDSFRVDCAQHSDPVLELPIPLIRFQCSEEQDLILTPTSRCNRVRLHRTHVTVAPVKNASGAKVVMQLEECVTKHGRSLFSRSGVTGFPFSTDELSALDKKGDGYHGRSVILNSSSNT